MKPILTPLIRLDFFKMVSLAFIKAMEKPCQLFVLLIITNMKTRDFGIFPKIPACFSLDYAVDDIPTVSKRDILDYLEYHMMTNGSVKTSATLISDTIVAWRCSTRPKRSIYQ